jgi:hypothetical protein
MQQIGAAMRKLPHLVFGILKSKQPFALNYLRKTKLLLEFFRQRLRTHSIERIFYVRSIFRLQGILNT